MGSISSTASGTDGAFQVGGVEPGPGFHAALWSGSAASLIDLNPVGFAVSEARAVRGGFQVGDGTTTEAFNSATYDYHALLWHGTAASVVDLHPVGFTRSQAVGLSQGKQVGWASNPFAGLDSGFVPHAIVWAGAAASAVDLHKFLPSTYQNSTATGIDALGNISGYAENGDGVTVAVLWVPVTKRAR